MAGVTLSPLPPAPDWMARVILSVLEDAYHRRGVFADLPPGSMDRFVQAMPPLPGLTTEEMRRVYFEASNGVGPRLGVAEHPRRDEVEAAVRRRDVGIFPEGWDSFRFNRKVAQKHVKALTASGDLPDGLTINVEEDLNMSARHEVGPASLWIRLWCAYRPAPVIHSCLSFHLDRGNTSSPFANQIARIEPKRVVMDQRSAVVFFERDFESALRTHLRYARLVLEAATRALAATLH